MAQFPLYYGTFRSRTKFTSDQANALSDAHREAGNMAVTGPLNSMTTFSGPRFSQKYLTPQILINFLDSLVVAITQGTISCEIFLISRI